ncbi:unnamed protein product [Arabis nemorensis]|uniref:TF-B3 domain-containing protein n=1 Tax=Arabis nemorensis TaxID=586526 RepID=A0A565BPE1_9BRAS|nr:unnamed protein product [Arabis nemorensis]
MASSSSKRPRSEDDQEEEEETHFKKHKFDLNKEPEPEEEIDLNKEAQVEEEENEEHIDKETEEQEAAFALSHIMFLRDITEEEEETEHQEKSLDSVLWLDEKDKERWTKKNKHEEAEKEEWDKRMKFIAKSKEEEEDDSDSTLGLLRRWNIPAIPPENIIKRNLIEKCSKPIRKQMTKREGKQSFFFLKLGLSKSQVTKKFLPFLEETKIQQREDGIRVSVYGPDGKVHEMKMYLNEKKNELDLTFGWRKFVEDYELKEICDFVTVWMFRHKQSREICLAIDKTRLSFRKQVSKRISKAVFDDSD